MYCCDNIEGWYGVGCFVKMQEDEINAFKAHEAPAEAVLRTTFQAIENWSDKIKNYLQHQHANRYKTYTTIKYKICKIASA
jgi:hypothetical protein